MSAAGRDDERSAAAFIDALYQTPADLEARSDELRALDRVRALYRELPREEAPAAAVAKILAAAAPPAGRRTGPFAWLRGLVGPLVVSPALAAAASLLLVAGIAGVLISRGQLEVVRPAGVPSPASPPPVAGAPPSPEGRGAAPPPAAVDPAPGAAPDPGAGAASVTRSTKEQTEATRPSRAHRRAPSPPPAERMGGAPIQRQAAPEAAAEAEEEEVGGAGPSSGSGAASAPAPAPADKATVDRGEPPPPAKRPSPATAAPVARSREVARLHQLAVTRAAGADCAGVREVLARLRLLDPGYVADHVAGDVRLAHCLGKK